MKKFFAVLVAALVLVSVLPATVVDTQADWNMASAIVQAIQRPDIPEDYSVNIKDMGAKGDGSTNDLPILQQAIDETSERGGGRVIVPAGTYYMAGPVVLKSCVDLHLEEGSTLLFSPNPEDYPIVETRWEGTRLMNYSPFVYAYGQHDIAITGKGTIDGNAESEFHSWKSKEKADQVQLRLYGSEGVPVEDRVFGEGHYLRPGCVQINYCQRVLLEDYTVTNSPFWVNHLNCSDYVQVNGITVDSMFANNDGVDVESSTYVVVENCKFHTGDDSVVIKSGRDYDGRVVARPSKYVVVRNNDMGGEDGIALGSEMSGGIEWVFFENNLMRDGVSAVRFKANLDRGATVSHIRVRNMEIGNFQNFIFFELKYSGELGGNFPSIYSDLVFEDLHIQSVSGNIFDAKAPAGYPLQNVTIQNVKIDEATNPNAFIIENVKDLVIDNFEINDQRMTGFLSSI